MTGHLPEAATPVVIVLVGTLLPRWAIWAILHISACLQLVDLLQMHLAQEAFVRHSDACYPESATSVARSLTPLFCSLRWVNCDMAGGKRV